MAIKKATDICTIAMPMKKTTHICNIAMEINKSQRYMQYSNGNEKNPQIYAI